MKPPWLCYLDISHPNQKKTVKYCHYQSHIPKKNLPTPKICPKKAPAAITGLEGGDHIIRLPRHIRGCQGDSFASGPLPGRVHRGHGETVGVPGGQKLKELGGGGATRRVFGDFGVAIIHVKSVIDQGWGTNILNDSMPELAADWEFGSLVKVSLEVQHPTHHPKGTPIAIRGKPPKKNANVNSYFQTTVLIVFCHL